MVLRSPIYLTTQAGVPIPPHWNGVRWEAVRETLKEEVVLGGGLKERVWKPLLQVRWNFESDVFPG